MNTRAAMYGAVLILGFVALPAPPASACQDCPVGGALIKEVARLVGVPCWKEGSEVGFVKAMDTIGPSPAGGSFRIHSDHYVVGSFTYDGRGIRDGRWMYLYTLKDGAAFTYDWCRPPDLDECLVFSAAGSAGGGMGSDAVEKLCRRLVAHVP